MNWVIKQRKEKENETVFYIWLMRFSLGWGRRTVMRIWCCGELMEWVCDRSERWDECAVHSDISGVLFTILLKMRAEVRYLSRAESRNSVWRITKSGMKFSLGLVYAELIFVHLSHCLRQDSTEKQNQNNGIYTSVCLYVYMYVLGEIGLHK